MKILVVDDYKGIRKSLKRLLTSYDHDVVTAEDGSSALEILKNQNGKEKQIELVITDYMMNIMNGEELARAIKSSDNLLPVICISTLGSYLDECPYFDYVLDKPFDNSHLISIINNLLYKKVD